jgi:ABC-type ATPase with predicted acetyltransferase domain
MQIQQQAVAVLNVRGSINSDLTRAISLSLRGVIRVQSFGDTWLHRTTVNVRGKHSRAIRLTYLNTRARARARIAHIYSYPERAKF